MANKKNIVPIQTNGKAPPHGQLANNKVHVFVDDQNLFYGITNHTGNRGYRIDFGRLLTSAAKDVSGKDRFVSTAFIAGVIPDDDTFWQKAQKEGFEVKRGFISNNSSKCDDSYLVAEIMETIYEGMGYFEVLVKKGSALAVSDVGAGINLAFSALESASLNIFINTSMMKDRKKALELNNQAEDIIENAKKLKAKVYDEVLEKIK